MAVRYDQKKKDEVVAFVSKYNEENGRGGQSAAVAKWKLNPITVKSWMEKAGVSSPGRSGKKKKAAKVGRKPAKRKYTRKAKTATKTVANVAAPSSVSGSLKRMVEIQEQIDSLQAEYESLKSTL